MRSLSAINIVPRNGNAISGNSVGLVPKALFLANELSVVSLAFLPVTAESI
jgi:hypothetical protein